MALLEVTTGKNESESVRNTESIEGLKVYLESLSKEIPEGEKISPYEKGQKILKKAETEYKYTTSGLKGELLGYHTDKLNALLKWEYGKKIESTRSTYSDKIKVIFGNEKPKKGEKRYSRIITLYSDNESDMKAEIEKIEKTGVRFLEGRNHFDPSVIGKSESFAGKIVCSKSFIEVLIDL